MEVLTDQCLSSSDQVADSQDLLLGLLGYDPNMTWDVVDISRRKHISLINLDDLFHRDPTSILINGDVLYSANRVENFRQRIFQNINDELGFVPKCACGYMSGMYKVDSICPRCGTKCSHQFVNSLNHPTWIGFTEATYVDKHGQVRPVLGPVLHPIWWSFLKKWTAVSIKAPTKKNTSFLDIIVDPSLPIHEVLLPLGIDKYNHRGFQWLYENADLVLDFFMDNPKLSKKPMAAWMRLFREKYRDMMFTRHLPILHNSLAPSKNDGPTLVYIDETTKNLMHAVLNLSDLVFRVQTTPMHPKRILTAQAKVYRLAFAYYVSILKDKIGGKPAIIRKHNYGSRLHFSARAVIVAQDRSLPMDEIVLPWGIVVTLMKHVILNYLIHKYNYNVYDAYVLYNTHIRKYHPLIDQCLQDYIHDTPNKAIAIKMGRNPTMNYLSMMLLWCRRYYKDPAIEVISINACLSKPPNFRVLYRSIIQDRSTPVTSRLLSLTLNEALSYSDVA